MTVKKLYTFLIDYRMHLACKTLHLIRILYNIYSTIQKLQYELQYCVWTDTLDRLEKPTDNLSQASGLVASLVEANVHRLFISGPLLCK